MVKSAISLSAHAKINLHLEVLGKRSDGFHDIVSVFHSISLSDEILIERTAEKDTCKVLSPLLALPETNTVISAYKKFSAACGIRDGIIVKILKNIPCGAGLGGGSSDAAAVLQGLNIMFNAGLTEESLRKIALEIGSDVPFFLKGGAAVVGGRGELLKPVSVKCGYFGVLVYPGITSGTAAAYKLLNRSENAVLPAFDPEPFCGEDCRKWPFFNSFEEEIFKVFPVVKKVKDYLLSGGADFALMSGSGSSVFGLFEDEKKAEIAYFELLKQYKQCFLFFLLAL
ncbi:4-(cytidine 5'-diphospho)-2-C-methyl-D-erythritol kinase [Treponema pedis]|uniref:4-diphosphocytidyl-2-C-methyl-D-erythritol kinase n=1 Tax=Treponema pedis TaxID=409322 RepID=A0A7S7AXE0_9SPIR|nr:4-(cytidine 5'-diphospho)-2-C-methyl-D-erythritol kinase [Treponema pedis]QOW61867.1 4-(cytidine 5'-diphospho)-2-C-methyl-D-erythritol kinase [Treponema pedis]